MSVEQEQIDQAIHNAVPGGLPKLREHLRNDFSDIFRSNVLNNASEQLPRALARKVDERIDALLCDGEFHPRHELG